MYFKSSCDMLPLPATRHFPLPRIYQININVLYLTESNSVTAVRALTGQNLDWGTIYPKLMVYPYNICMSNKGPQGAPM